MDTITTTMFMIVQTARMLSHSVKLYSCMLKTKKATIYLYTRLYFIFLYNDNAVNTDIFACLNLFFNP